jgi:hypothetical protein
MLMMLSASRLQMLAGFALALGTACELLQHHDMALIMISAGIAWGTTSTKNTKE